MRLQSKETAHQTLSGSHYLPKSRATGAVDRDA